MSEYNCGRHLAKNCILSRKYLRNTCRPQPGHNTKRHIEAFHRQPKLIVKSSPFQRYWPNKYFGDILANWTTSGSSNLTGSTRGHIKRSRPFTCYQNQIYRPVHSRDMARANLISAHFGDILAIFDNFRLIESDQKYKYAKLDTYTFHLRPKSTE